MAPGPAAARLRTLRRARAPALGGRSGSALAAALAGRRRQPIAGRGRRWPRPPDQLRAARCLLTAAAAGGRFRVRRGAGRGRRRAARPGPWRRGGGAEARRPRGGQPAAASPCDQSPPTFPGLVRRESDGAARGRRAAAAAAALGAAAPPGRRGGRAAGPPEEAGVHHRAEERCRAGTGDRGPGWGGGRRAGTGAGPAAGARSRASRARRPREAPGRGALCPRVFPGSGSAVRAAACSRRAPSLPRASCGSFNPGDNFMVEVR